MSQIETFPRLACSAVPIIPPQQIPLVLSEMEFECPPPHNATHCFSLRISLEVPPFTLANDAVTRVHRLRGGGWGLAGMDDARKHAVRCPASARFSFRRAPRCQFSSVLPACALQARHVAGEQLAALQV